MTITAKYAGTCTRCRQTIKAGDQIEWAKGQGGKHVSCSHPRQGAVATQSSPALRPTSHRRACRTGGNCSSFGSGRSCGGYDCDGY